MNGDTFEARYLSGRELYGDDFDADEIAEWFESEREGYANLGSGAADGGGPDYSYHALNTLHGFRHLPPGRFGHALGVGSAYGEEFGPIADRIDRLTILEPSQQLVSSRIGGLVPKYVVPDPSGTMPFGDGTFDLVACFGTLHHIPNVTHVVSEIGRVLAPGGHALIREPIVSMGDWRNYRGPGCTEKERGIPLQKMREALGNAGLVIDHESLTGFPPVVRLAIKAGISPYKSKAVTLLDAMGATVSRPLYRYHAETTWQKIRPTSAMFVARKP